jgi:uncharacterized membrane protein YeiH
LLSQLFACGPAFIRFAIERLSYGCGSACLGKCEYFQLQTLFAARQANTIAHMKRFRGLAAHIVDIDLAALNRLFGHAAGLIHTSGPKPDIGPHFFQHFIRWVFHRWHYRIIGRSGAQQRRKRHYACASLTESSAQGNIMLLYLLDLIGVAVFAISGVLVAARSGMDLLGGLALAALTAIGGGTLRDVLLNRHPIFWIRDARYLIVILVAALLTMTYIVFYPPPVNSLLIADGLGLALFAISGAQIAEADGHSPLIVILMGTMTGTAGGMLRDVMSARVPMIFQQDLYATAAIAGVIVYLVLQKLGLSRTFAVSAGVLVILALRVAAVMFGWHLPRLHAMR